MACYHIDMTKCTVCGNDTNSKYEVCRSTPECRRQADVLRSRAYRKKTEAPPSGKVYVIGSEDFSYVKVGYSIRSRLEQLQVGNPFELKLLAIFPAERTTEELLHQQLRDWRVRGEWYELGPHEEAIEAVRCAIELGSDGLDISPTNLDRGLIRKLKPKKPDSRAKKLTSSDVRNIHELRKLGISIAELAEAAEVSRQTISYIVNGRAWKNV